MINDFYIGVQNNHLGRILLEKLYISRSLGHSINISNPYLLEIRDSTIDGATKSAINIRFSKEVKSVPKERRVFIERNEITRGNTYGISIFGENMRHHKCKVQIIDNKIASCMKEGIGIKNININKINISKNQIYRTSGSGIFL